MCTPSETSTVVMSLRPGYNATVDYSTQGNIDQPSYWPLSGLTHVQQLVLNTCNYLLPDGSRRTIYDIPAPQHQLFMLGNGHAAYQMGNGHAAYQIELENLEPILETNIFLMDRLSGQFHAVYEDGYRQMVTTPVLLHLCAMCMYTRDQVTEWARCKISNKGYLITQYLCHLMS